MAGLPADAEPPSGARPAARGEGRDAILEAAAAAFTERGYTATTIDDIADRLGATKGRVYHYYRSKADIFLDIHRYAMQRMLDEMTPLAAAPGPAAARIAGMVRAHALLLMASFPFQRVSVQGLERHLAGQVTERQRSALEGVIQMRDAYEALFVGVLEAGVTSGEFRPVVARRAVKPILGSLNWLTVWYRPRQPEDAAAQAAIADEMVEFVVRGLRP
ncbi:TetR family transcriptional regulator [Stella humosa]|uniref:TetR family transcriptional regulator n=1 Tax=Stella humosa TaxID=94 RepID=A0A3N1LHG8_9PROT|nr:TetR/AcrR family transcriptional regulator [Stella humosa]ROP90802.1 TetR family transcriptional regulator [Stella humosa]BBK34852.1 TetR family transcriptional regulator [Stella humosa]